MLNSSPLNFKALGAPSPATVTIYSSEVTLLGGAKTLSEQMNAIEGVLAAVANHRTVGDVALLVAATANGYLPIKTFYNPSTNTHGLANATMTGVTATSIAVQSVMQAGATSYGEVGLNYYLQARAAAPTTSSAYRVASEALIAAAGLPEQYGYAVNIADILQAVDEYRIPVVVATVELVNLLTAGDQLSAEAEALMESVLAALQHESGLGLTLVEIAAVAMQQDYGLTVFVEDRMDAEAGDSAYPLAHYTKDVRDIAGSWVTFKVAGELVQGWVMNLEGGKPFSEYSEYAFNSFASLDNAYYAAADDGIYMVNVGDTDDGEPIDASIQTMMLDFDTAAQKRVLSAYLGYRSTGELLLKIKSVDDGMLVEQWYEAVATEAPAPQESYRQLGRGMKSRYWQFELVNVDGSDFELDRLEVHPIRLSRRV